tara:strand:- start:1805 stop:2560 length:756 start_codon:yes stop_codon:yes gene_type:complete
MAFARGPKISTNGIVFSIDPASHKSYPGTGTKVYELTKYGKNLSNSETYNSASLGGGTTFLSNSGSGAFGFDGTNDTLTFANPGAGQYDPFDFGTGPMTMEAWVKFEQTHSVNTLSVIVTRGNPLCDNCQGGYNLMFNDEDTVSVRFDATGAGGIDSVSFTSSSYDFRDGNFHHVVGLRDGVNVKLYFDGAEVATNNNDNQRDVSVADGFHISGWSSYRGQMEVGPVRLYNRAISSEEVADNYAASIKRYR